MAIRFFVCNVILSMRGKNKTNKADIIRELCPFLPLCFFSMTAFKTRFEAKLA